MNILVIGAGGMAGHVISLYFSEKGYNVTSLTRKKIDFLPNNILGDASDSIFLGKLLKKHKYEIVINCVGILNQFADDNKSEAILLNSYLPHYVASILKDTRTKLIHMSTDCVFAGNTGPYHEYSFKDGTTFYDRTKSLGEIDDDKNLTFRNSIVGPDTSKSGIGLFNWFMNQKGPIKGFTRAIWTGVTTPILAEAMERAIFEDLSGIYNLVNNDAISKFELLNLFNHFFRNNRIEIFPDDRIKLDKSLVCNRTDFSFIIPSYSEMIEQMRKWMDEHKYLYHYY